MFIKCFDIVRKPCFINKEKLLTKLKTIHKQSYQHGKHKNPKVCR